MYLRRAVACCRDLEEEVAKIYQELAHQHAGDEALAALWNELAAEERMHSRLFTALLASQDLLEDDGPFLVDLPLRINNVRRLLDASYARVRKGIGADEALDLAERIETSELDELATEVVEISRDALSRMTAVVEVSFGRDNVHQQRIRAFRSQRAIGEVRPAKRRS